MKYLNLGFIKRCNIGDWMNTQDEHLPCLFFQETLTVISTISFLWKRVSFSSPDPRPKHQDPVTKVRMDDVH